MKTGIIDIGSNSVRMAWLDGVFHIGLLPEERLRYSRFAEGATVTGMLGAAAVARTIDAIQSLLTEAADNGVSIERISATSALREAGNREAVLAQMEAAVGRSITVLKAEEEAALSYRGATAGLPSAGRTLVVLDVGGGSTELCWGEGAGCAASVPIGAVRLKEAAAQIGALSTALAPLVQQAPKGSGITLVGVGGTLTSMAALFEGMTTYQPQLIHQLTYGVEAVEQINELLKAMPVEQRVTLPGMAAGRADIITQGLDIALHVMKALRTQTITISTTDLLLGQLMQLTNNE